MTDSGADEDERALERDSNAEDDDALREAASEVEDLPPADAAAMMATLADEDAARLVECFDPDTAASVLSQMSAAHASRVVQAMHVPEASVVLAAMEPDDRVDVLERLADAIRNALIAELPDDDAVQVRTLAKYPPDTAGGIMTTQVTALPEHVTVEDAIALIRRLSEELEQVYYAYVVNAAGRLVGVLSMRDLILARPQTPISCIMRRAVVHVAAMTDQEQVARLMRERGFMALPVVAADDDDRLLGLITVDDVVDVAAEEATEDIQKLGGSEALDAPYMEVGFRSMVRKRGGWLSALFLGEMLTATAMGYFEHEIARAVVLAMFVPLIISSGGNSGSQAATIVVRSLALSELRLRDWWRVLGRELRTSATLGVWLGFIGFVRVALWQRLGWISYGEHYLLIGLTVWVSLVGVVTFGSVAGSMLPFLLRWLGFDPAASSAPFVATLVDVTGLVIYFSAALLILRGTLL